MKKEKKARKKRNVLIVDANSSDVFVYYDNRDCDKIQKIHGFKLAYHFQDTCWNEYGRLYVNGIYLRFLAFKACE